MNHLKIIQASQGPIRKYEDLKRKLYHCNAHIYFNKQCTKKHLIPNYAKVKVPNTSPAAKFTLHKAQLMRVKDELKFLHVKKQWLNHQIYKIHLLLANTWGKTWPYIHLTIEDKLKKAIQHKYTTLDNKLDRLSQIQTKKPNEIHTFYPRVVNNTNITFTDNETNLLNKGPKYNLHSRKKDWLMTLALEAETAVTSLSLSDRDYYRKQVASHIEKLHKSFPLTHTQKPES